MYGDHVIFIFSYKAALWLVREYGPVVLPAFPQNPMN